ncbi:MAG: MG2 domain-containing protein [bacterium]|nr:MG2 domain-containing protein [bacterium]
MKVFKLMKVFIFFVLILSFLGFAFEYQITGPKRVSSLEGIKYRIIVFNNIQNQSIPIKIMYRNRVLAEKYIKKDHVFNIDLSGMGVKEYDQVDLDFRIGQDQHIVSLQYVPEYKGIIFTDKPLYQPGQTVYIKGVVLKNKKPINSKVHIFIEDPKGNKMFYKEIIPKNGLFFEKFVISDLVVNGIYRLVLQKDGKNLAVNSFEIKKYKLPKFKIETSFVGDPKIFEIGKTYRVRVQASYFFGKKVSNANVKVDMLSFDVGFNKIYSVEGKTDSNGEFYFTLNIPEYLVGVDKSKGILRIDLEVEDQAGQVEKKSHLIEVFSSPIVAYLIPANRVIKDLDNKFYLVVSYADSSEGSFRVNFIKPFRKSFETKGFLEFSYRPTSESEEFLFEVSDDKGNKQKFTEKINSVSDKEVFIFRDKAIYKIGQTLEFKLYSNFSGYVYLDFFVKSGNSYRTVFNDTVYLEAFKIKSYMTNINPDFKGELIVRAYFLKSDGTVSNNFKSFIIQDPGELKINVRKNKDTYTVRENLVLSIDTSEKAEIFVDIVDEALLYLSRSDPELLKLYLQLEKEILEPRYEIHNVKEVIIFNKQGILKAMLDRKNWSEGYTDQPSDLQNLIAKDFVNINSVQEKTRKTLKKMESLYTKVYNYYFSFKQLPSDFREIGLRKNDCQDEWGTEFKLSKKNDSFEIISAGVDRKFGTEDDIKYPSRIGEIFINGREFRITAFKKGEISTFKDKSDKADLKDDLIVRQYFPETFYSSLISVDKFKTLSLTLPDSITTWRAQFFGISESGKLGSKSLDITVFQNFFIDLDAPIFLTKDDEVSIPVVVYNYTNKELNVMLQIQKEKWFELLDQETKEILVKPNSNTSVYFKIKAEKIGINTLTVFAYSGRFRDAIKKQIEVIPNGFIVENNKSVYISNVYDSSFVIPVDSIDRSHRVYLYIYPSFSSQLLSGLDKLLAIPYGCFEQTSSINYPNILILKYLRNRGISNPGLEMKAEYYLNVGYQRLITFEVEGGGFSWFGDKPANKVLSAFGLMQFKDMKSVFFVDQKIIDRTKKFLIDQQESDGSWEPDKNYLHQESWENIQKQKITTTAYILMALLDNDEKIYQEYTTQISKAFRYVYRHFKDNVKSIDNYTLGLILNIFADLKDREKEARAGIDIIIDELNSRSIKQGKWIYWKGAEKTLFYGQNSSSDIETTSIIGLGLIKLKRFDLANQVIKYLISSKDSKGMWYSTQPTILALKTITSFDISSNSLPKSNKVNISINGRDLKTEFSSKDIAYKIVDITSFVSKGKNVIRIRSENKLLVDIYYTFYMPFTFYKPIQDLIDIDVKYDRTELSSNDRVKAYVNIRNRTKKVLEMVVVDLGIPPGFNVDISRLEGNTKVRNVELTSRQIIVYFERFDPEEVVSLEYELVSKYPLKVKVPVTKAYEYYNPSNTVIKEGQIMVVR